MEETAQQNPPLDSSDQPAPPVKSAETWARQVSIAERRERRVDSVGSSASSQYEDVVEAINPVTETPTQQDTTPAAPAQPARKGPRKKKDPAYIPKTGYYFEHDSRDDHVTKTETKTEEAIAGSDAVVPVEEALPIREEVPTDRPIEADKKANNQQRSGGRKPARNGPRRAKNFNGDIDHDIDDQERWVHDRFDMDEQKPKSQSEIVSKYGFDIRKAKDLDAVEVIEEARPQQPQQQQKKKPQSSRGFRKKQFVKAGSEQQRTTNQETQSDMQGPGQFRRSSFSNDNRRVQKNTNQANSVEPEDTESLNSHDNYRDVTKLRRQRRPQDKNFQNKEDNYHEKTLPPRQPSQINEAGSQSANRRPYSSRSNGYYTNRPSQPVQVNNKPPPATPQQQQSSTVTRTSAYQPKHLQLEDSITYNEQRVATVRPNHRGGHTNIGSSSTNQIVSQNEASNTSNNSEGPKRYSTIRNNRQQAGGAYHNPGLQHHQSQPYNGYNNVRPHSYQYNSHHQPIMAQQQAQYYYVHGQQQQHEYAPASNTIYYNNHNQMIVNNSVYHQQHQQRQSRAIPIVNPVNNGFGNGY